MTSFLEKLKKGMGIEEPIDKELIEHKPPSFQKKTEKKKKEVPAPALISGTCVSKEKPQKLEIKVEKIEPAKPEKKPETKEIYPVKSPAQSGGAKQFNRVKKEKWFEQGGQLAVDIYQTKDELIIRSAIAGVKPEDLDISIENDVLSIEGQRQKSSEEQGEDYFVKECYWGAFSKEIVLPVETDTSRVKAEMKQGILIIRLPKIEREKKRKVVVKE